MPSGGRRIGAGRKPKILQLADGRVRMAPLPPAVGADVRAQLLQPPLWLTPGAALCWAQWAPQALAERTLTPATVAGFGELCTRMALVQALDVLINAFGVQALAALPYLRERRAQGAQLNVSLKDFKLSAFGKPATTEKPAGAANPFAAVG